MKKAAEDDILRKIPITYGIREEIYCLGNERRLAFGIVAYSNAETDGTATVIESVGDVTDDRAALENLVRKCNGEGLDPRDLYAIAEDFIG